MASEKGMLLVFDGDPTEDEMLSMMKTLKQNFNKLQTGKRTREETPDIEVDDKRKLRKKLIRKRKYVDKSPAATESIDKNREDLVPTDSCAMPTVKVRKLNNTQIKTSARKERRLDSRLKRLLKSKQKKSQEGASLSDECSVNSNDSGVHMGSEPDQMPVISTCGPSTEPEQCQGLQMSSESSVPKESPKKAPHMEQPCPHLNVKSGGNKGVNLIPKKSKGAEELPTQENKSDNAKNGGQVDESMYVAMDCEFVGVGPKGCRSALGRCSVVDYAGRTLCDVYARPEEPIVDYRTKYSGIRPRHMKNAVPLDSARRMVKKVLKDKIVIGHAVWNDFGVLRIKHPPHMIRDTSTYSPLHQMASKDSNPPRSLKKLSAALLGRNIQTGPHSSIEDSLATLDLFKLVRERWEKELAENTVSIAATKWRSRTLSETSVENTYLKDDYWPSDI